MFLLAMFNSSWIAFKEVKGESKFGFSLSGCVNRIDRARDIYR